MDALYDFTQNPGRPVDVFIANAGRRLGGAFLDQDFADIRRVIDTNVRGSVYLTQRIARDMRRRGAGLSAAFELARAGRRVVAIDRGPIGGGMTARATKRRASTSP